MRNARHTLAALGVLGAVSIASAPASASANKETTQDFLNYWTEYFQNFDHRNPDVRRGSGFMAFNRYKDHVSRRFPNLAETGGNLPAGERIRAFEELKAMEEQQGRAGETWFNIGPTNFAGRCLAIAVHPTDPETVYAGFAQGGIWKSTNGGTTWTPLGDTLLSMAVSAIEIDSTNPDRVWIATGEGWGNVDGINGVGVLVSTDAGTSWGTTGLTYARTNGANFYHLEYNPTSGVLIAAGPGLWRSTDQGANFTQIQTLGVWHDVEMKRGSTNTWFASSRAWAGFGFYVSTDDGATWTFTSEEVAAPLNQNRFALTNADPNTIYWCINNTGTTMRIMKSTDGGFGWTQVFTGSHYNNQGWYNFTVDVAQTNTTTVYSGGVEFYRSTNSGATFSNWSGGMHVDHHATAWAPSDNNRFYVGSDGGVYKSTNGGNTFTSCNNGLVTSQFYAMASSLALPTRALGGTQDNGTWRYDNSTNWTNVLGGDGFQCEADPTNSLVMYGEIYYGQHYRTVNGTSWFVKVSGITQDGPWETPTWQDLADPNWLWAGHNTHLYRTTNQMNNWTQVAGYTPSGESRSISQSPANTNIMADAHNALLYISTDHGVTWASRTTGLVNGGTISDVTFDPVDENIAYATCASYSSTSISQVYKTTNQGLNWFASDNGLPNEPMNTIEVHPDNPSWVFVGSDLAVYASVDAGANWTPLNNGLPYVEVSDMRINAANNFIRISTHGRGFWEVDISNFGTTAVGETQAIQPLTLKLFGNPATDRTTLRFGMRQAGNYSLGIFDANGRKVLAVKDGFMHASVDNAEVNVSGLAAGVYFARLDANGAQVSQKLVIQR
ncbi:MAG: T9SS type A sorting domain-containing protein [Candidatus Eisenbacteria bacterium]|nr:T9SS type A sorting domain-containing protein [Candidatus Eisenbacteria bacterium]